MMNARLNLANLMITMGDFDASFSLLAEASEHDQGGKSSRILETYATLHERWHKSDPDAGHDAKAAEYRAQLKELTTTDG